MHDLTSTPFSLTTESSQVQHMSYPWIDTCKDWNISKISTSHIILLTVLSHPLAPLLLFHYIFALRFSDDGQKVFAHTVSGVVQVVNICLRKIFLSWDAMLNIFRKIASHSHSLIFSFIETRIFYQALLHYTTSKRRSILSIWLLPLFTLGIPTSPRSVVPLISRASFLTSSYLCPVRTWWGISDASVGTSSLLDLITTSRHSLFRSSHPDTRYLIKSAWDSTRHICPPSGSPTSIFLPSMTGCPSFPSRLCCAHNLTLSSQLCTGPIARLSICAIRDPQHGGKKKRSEVNDTTHTQRESLFRNHRCPSLTTTLPPTASFPSSD